MSWSHPAYIGFLDLSRPMGGFHRPPVLRSLSNEQVLAIEAGVRERFAIDADLLALCEDGVIRIETIGRDRAALDLRACAGLVALDLFGAITCDGGTMMGREHLEEVSRRAAPRPRVVESGLPRKRRPRKPLPAIVSGERSAAERDADARVVRFFDETFPDFLARDVESPRGGAVRIEVRGVGHWLVRFTRPPTCTRTEVERKEMLGGESSGFLALLDDPDRFDEIHSRGELFWYQGPSHDKLLAALARCVAEQAKLDARHREVAAIGDGHEQIAALFADRGAQNPIYPWRAIEPRPEIVPSLLTFARDEDEMIARVARRLLRASGRSAHAYCMEIAELLREAKGFSEQWPLLRLLRIVGPAAVPAWLSLVDFDRSAAVEALAALGVAAAPALATAPEPVVERILRAKVWDAQVTRGLDDLATALGRSVTTPDPDYDARAAYLLDSVFPAWLGDRRPPLEHGHVRIQILGVGAWSIDANAPLRRICTRARRRARSRVLLLASSRAFFQWLVRPLYHRDVFVTEPSPFALVGEMRAWLEDIAHAWSKTTTFLEARDRDLVFEPLRRGHRLRIGFFDRTPPPLGHPESPTVVRPLTATDLDTIRKGMRERFDLPFAQAASDGVLLVKVSKNPFGVRPDLVAKVAQDLLGTQTFREAGAACERWSPERVDREARFSVAWADEHRRVSALPPDARVREALRGIAAGADRWCAVDAIERSEELVPFIAASMNGPRWTRRWLHRLLRRFESLAATPAIIAALNAWKDEDDADREVIDETLAHLAL